MNTDPKRAPGSARPTPRTQDENGDSDRSTKLVFYGFVGVLVLAVLMVLIKSLFLQ